jgi:galactose mutarotase-like enzyme
VRLDSQLLPTDRWASEPAEHRKLGRRRFDDHFALGRDRRFSLTGNNRRVEVRFDRGYPSAQIYLPPAGMSGWLNTDFICIEPMTAPINALVHGVAPVATPSNSYAATFTISASRQSPERH